MCSFRYGRRVVRAIISQFRGSGGPVYPFHAFCRSRVFHYRLSGVVPYSYGAQAFGHDRRNRCPIRRSRERHCGVDALGFECRLGQRGFWTDSIVDPLDLRRVDAVLTSRGEEVGFVGRRPDWFNQQWPVKEFHDLRYPTYVRIRVLHRCYRRPRHLWCVLVFIPNCVSTEALIGAFVTGLIVPREGNLAIIITEKLEDAVSIIFLPLVRVSKSSGDDA